jgi:3-hydroxybutyryl-CoA dehydratase
VRVPKVGDTARRSMEITPNKIIAFARMSGDRNPLHFDDVFARQMGFEGGRIAHGMLVSAIVSALVGEDLPGLGAIFLEQRIRYVAPTYMHDTITGALKVTKVRKDKPVITLAVQISRSDGTLVADGEAVVLMREPKQPRPIANTVGSQTGITADATSWHVSGVDFSYLLALPCPRCHAALGRICRAFKRGRGARVVTTKPAGWPHLARRRAYAAQTQPVS